MTAKVVLTRPENSSRQVLAACEAAFGKAVMAEFSPILRIIPVGAWPDLTAFQAVLLSSAHGVQGRLDGLRAYCVGNRTAMAAEGAGAKVVMIARDADHLPDDIPERPMVYLRGAHVSTDLATRYGCSEKIVYDQHSIPLTKAALNVLTGEKHVILPLFSSRSARLIAKEVAQLGQRVHIIAMSAAIAEAWGTVYTGPMPDPSVEICAEPTQIEMVGRIVASLQSLSGGKTG